MAVRVTCPNGHTLSLKDELAGKRIKCPTCQTAFVATGAASTAVTAEAPARKPARAAAASAAPSRRKRDDEDDDKPRKKSPSARDDDEDDTPDDPRDPEERRKDRIRDKRRRLKLVNTGLLLHLIKLWIYVILILAVLLNVVFLIIISVVSDVAQADRDISPEALVLFAFLQFLFIVGCGICVIVAPIVGVVGSGFCMMVPKKSESRGTIITSFVFDIIPLVGSIILVLAMFDVFGLEPAKLERLNSLIQIGAGVFTLAAWFLFMVFLRALGQYLGAPGLGNEALNLIAYLIVEVVSLPITMIMTLYMFRFMIALVGSFLGIVIMFIVSILWFAQFYYLFFVGMIRLLNAMREVVRENS